jgi:flavin reductase (DIM6/NTAB) family NADH-FMN oxidoreductase RutF
MIPHGLQIVTVRDGDRFHGYTSSWMTQGSFTPPLVILGVKRDSLARSMMAKEKVFAIHFPGKDQLGLVKAFFKAPAREGGTLGGVPFRVGERTGCPLLEGVLAHAECRVIHEWEGGDHSVVVGEVLAVGVAREGDPLLLADTPWNYGG